MPNCTRIVQIDDRPQILPQFKPFFRPDLNFGHWSWEQFGGVPRLESSNSIHSCREMGHNKFKLKSGILKDELEKEALQLVALEGLVATDFSIIIGNYETWAHNGVLSVTTTSINDKDILHYHLNLREPPASKHRLKVLAPTNKSVGAFSGTEVCLLTAGDESNDDFVKWVVRFVQKMQILKIPDIAFELLVEHVDNEGSRCEGLLQETNDFSQHLAMSNIERLVSGLEDHVLKNRQMVTEECPSCAKHGASLKVGNGQANSMENNRGMTRVVEAVLVITPVSSCSCWKANCSSSQVLYFQDFCPSSIPERSLNALANIDWQNYGLRLKGSAMNEDGHVELEWEHMPLFARVDIALHCYQKRVIDVQQSATGDRHLIKKAVKFALDDLKRKYTKDFLSIHTLQIAEYVPDLSRTIAGLILSSNDLGFRGECATLLGLDSVDIDMEKKIEPVLLDKLTSIIEKNDSKPKRNRNAAPYLFECDNQREQEYQDFYVQEDIDTLDF